MSRSLRLLLVDDEPKLLKAQGRWLQRHGYDVVTAPDAPTALELVRGDAVGFDLVITDEVMPGMTGTALARALQELRPGLPTILSTGLAETLESHALPDGVTAVLGKPATTDDLDAAINAALVARA